MIYCNLKGGLGNMFFQIAATKSMAIDYGSDCSFPNLKSHLAYLDSEAIHNPALKHSNDYYKILKDFRTDEIPPNVTFLGFPFEYVENQVHSKEMVIDGFFQSEKYFAHNRSEIIKLFNFDFISKSYLKGKYGFLKQRVTSIHVRRGDYVKFPNHHPVQSMDYYNTGIDLLKDKTDIFMIFSDDIDWCKANFTHLKNVHFVENELDYIEIYLMSKCKNNIISNSSFSWWGAWLNENADKTVIGPLKWFGPAIQHNTGDVLPEKWIKI